MLWTNDHSFRTSFADLHGRACAPLTGLLAMLGEIASVAAVVQFAIIFMMFCAVWAVVGDKVARATFDPEFSSVRSSRRA
jgi:hypothetical protein